MIGLQTPERMVSDIQICSNKGTDSGSSLLNLKGEGSSVEMNCLARHRFEENGIAPDAREILL